MVLTDSRTLESLLRSQSRLTLRTPLPSKFSCTMLMVIWNVGRPGPRPDYIRARAFLYATEEVTSSAVVDGGIGAGAEAM